MAVPGWSVGDVILAASTLKQVYDAFFDKYDNAHYRVTELCHTVNLFHSNLIAHAEILERSGKHYPGFQDFEKTITECNDFLQKYVRRLSAAGGGGRGKIRAMVNTAAWSLEERNVDKLTRRLNLQIQALNSYALTVLLEKLSHGDEEPHVATEVVEPGRSQAQRPPLEVIRQNLLTGRSPLLIESPESSITAEDETLQQLMVRAMVSRNQIKRREIEALQRSRNNKSKRISADNAQLVLARSQYREEAQSLVRDWRRIALRNGLSEQNLPQISDSQPLENAEEFWKRALHASKIASAMPLSPLSSPRLGEYDDGFPPTSPPQPIIDSPELRPESGSLLSASPPDTIFTHRSRTSTNTVSPNSLGLLDPRRRPSSFVGSISLGLPAVIDCNAELTLRHRAAHYPALKIKRIEVHQLDSGCDIYCTTTKDLRIVHKIPRGHGTHPFTKHSCHERPFEVNFLESHKVVHDLKTYAGDPHYKFFSKEDCTLFQGSIRGKDLVLVYNVDKISFKTSDNLGDATDQHLKIWRDFDGGQFAMTFFANNPSDHRGRRHREFRLSRLSLASSGGKPKQGVVRLDFKAVSLPRRASRTPTGSLSGAVGHAGAAGPSGAAAAGLGLQPDFGGRAPSFVDRAAGPDAGATPSPVASNSASPYGSFTRVQTVSSTALSDDVGSPVLISEDGEEANKLRFVEIVFSDPKDVTEFVNVFESVQHL